MSRVKLSSSEVADLLQGIDGWSQTGEAMAIQKTFKFAGFMQAFAFMTECALFAEKNDHHPEWRNVYRTVEVTLTTHTSGGVTQLDFHLAAFMDQAASHH